MIKVLHLVSSLSICSGLMSVIMNYYRHIDRNNMQFGFLYFKDIKDHTYEDEIIDLGGECYLIDRPKISNDYRNSVNSFFTQHNDYNILHIHELYLGFIFAYSAKKYAKMRIVGHAHTTKYAERMIPAIRNRILCFPNKWLLDSMLACSLDAGKLYFGNKIIDNYKFHVLKNAIETKNYEYNSVVRAKYRAELGIHENEIVVGHVGRFSQQKNHYFIVDIIKKCVEDNRKYKFVLIGDGPLKHEIVETIKKYGLSEYVIFLGNRNDMAALYSTMDVFILPSCSEGLGLVAIEAQANGLQCLLSEEVPNEAVILEPTKKLSIHNGAQVWEKEIVELSKERINNSYEVITRSGYNISNEVKYLEEIYADLLH